MVKNPNLAGGRPAGYLQVWQRRDYQEATLASGYCGTGTWDLQISSPAP